MVNADATPMNMYRMYRERVALDSDRLRKRLVFRPFCG